jgi:hypothetical protein
MRDRPNAADLLAVALEVLQQKLLPRVPAELRFDALMIANAIANAEREAAAGDAPLRAEWERLAAHYGESLGSAALPAALARLNTRLGADIRAGRLDGNKEIARHLLATAVDAVRESNPKYLKTRDID